MNLLYNSEDKPLSNSVYLLNVMLQPICKLNGIDFTTGNFTNKLLDFSELSFEVNKYINVNDVQVTSNGYDKLKINSYLYVENIGYFKVNNEPNVTYADIEKKVIVAKSLDCEALQPNLVGFKVNCGTSDSCEYLVSGNIGEDGLAKNYVKFYDPENVNLSLMHILINYLKGWTIGSVDTILKTRQEKFDIDSKPLYSFLREDVSVRFRCVIIFDYLNLTVNAYDVETFGNDTSIFLSKRNLVNTINLNCNDSSVYTKFNVNGGDGLDDIRQANFGDNYIEDKTYFMNTDYLPQETCDKYIAWHTYRDLRRPDYVALTKQFVVKNDEINDLYYRVPNDILNNTWLGFDIDELTEQLTYYNALVGIFETNEDYFTDGEFDVDVLEDSGEGYYSYICYLGIVDNVKTALENYIKAMTLNDITSKYAEMNTALGDIDSTDYPYKHSSYTFVVGKLLHYKDNYSTADKTKSDFSTTWETNWDLYGIQELLNLKEEYVNKIDILFLNVGFDISYYSGQYSALSPTEKEKYSGETDFNTLKAKYTDLNTKLANLTEKLNTSQGIYNEGKSELETIQSNMTLLANEVNLESFDFDLTSEQISALTNKLTELYNSNVATRIMNTVSSSSGFTSDEITAIYRLDVASDYTNSNIITTTITTSSEKIDKELDLVNDAIKQLEIQSRPQINFDCEMNNLLSLPEFKSWHSSLNLGNYIYLEMTETYIEKLRLISMTYNPFEYSDNNFKIEFSNMLKSRQGINDFVSLLGSAIGSVSNGVSNKSTSSASDLEISADILQAIANSNAIKGKINSVLTDSIEANNAKFNYAFADELVAKLAIIEEGRFNTFTADTGFVKYLESNLVVSSAIKTDDLIAAIANIGLAQMETLQATSAFVSSMQSKVFTTDNAVAFQSFTENLVANYLTISSLFANNTTTNFITLGQDSNGNKIRMNNQLMQFVDSEDNVYIQIGLDTTGNPSIILKDGSGNVILNNQGITTDAIADGLIVSDMIAPKTDTYNGIEASKLNIDSVVASINNGTTSINSSRVYFDAENQSLNTLLSSMTDTITSVNGKLLYKVEIASSEGTSVDNGTTLTANVYNYGTTTIASGSFSYQWYKNGEPMSGKTASTLALTNADIGSGAQFTCKVSY